jgi:hypothetical protein
LYSLRVCRAQQTRLNYRRISKSLRETPAETVEMLTPDPRTGNDRRVFLGRFPDRAYTAG